MKKRLVKWVLSVMVLAMAGLALSAPVPQIIDVPHSTLDFSAESFLFDCEGTFKDWTGNVQLDREKIENSSVTVTIKAKSIDTRISKRDEHLRGPDFLNADKYPTITFKSTSIRKTGDKTFVMAGDLTLHGVTKNISLPVTIDRLQDEYSRFKAEFILKRSEFGITYNVSMNPIKDEIGVKLVVNLKRP